MKKIIAGMVVSVVLLGFLSVPVLAGNGKDYGEQPGYSKASDCGAVHGSFGYFGADTNLGVNSLGPGTPTYHNGAVGQEPGATGYNNSHTDCQ